jgi:hypothetical protein
MKNFVVLSLVIAIGAAIYEFFQMSKGMDAIVISGLAVAVAFMAVYILRGKQE